MNIWITLKRWYLQSYFRYVFYITGNVIFLSKQLSTKISQDKSQGKQNKRFSCYQRKIFMVLAFFLTCIEDESKCGTVMDFYSKVIKVFYAVYHLHAILKSVNIILHGKGLRNNARL